MSLIITSTTWLIRKSYNNSVDLAQVTKPYNIFLQKKTQSLMQVKLNHDLSTNKSKNTSVISSIHCRQIDNAVQINQIISPDDYISKIQNV